MRKLLYVLGGLIGLVAVAAIVFLMIPLDSLRGPAEQALSRQLGRGVHIAGSLHASLYPVIGVSTSDVSIDNVPGGQAQQLLRVGKLAIGAKLMPLLSRELDITTLTLEKPSIHLEVDASGNPNWAFNMPKSESQSSTANAKLSIAGLKISEGEITYSDLRKGTVKALSHANVTLSLASMDAPAEFALDAVYDGNEFSVSGSANSPNTYLAKTPTKVVLDLKSKLITLHFDGSVTGMTDNSGSFTVSGPSLRELIKQGSGTTAPTGGLGDFNASGAVEAKDQVYALKGAKIALDGMNATADLSVDTKGKTPALKGTVALDHLDLATYMVAKSSSPPPSGWSTEPIVLDGLKRADADIGITVGRLTLGQFVISDSRMHIGLAGGTLTADLAHAGLFNGAATGKVVASSAGRYAIKLNADGVAINSLLNAAMKVDRISGTGALTLDVTGVGNSQQAIVNSLAGTASISARNGAIKGVDLAAVSRTITNALAGALGAATKESSSTDFAEAGGTFKIAGGVMKNDDFHLLNPFVRITGNGEIALGPRTLDFHVVPRLVATAQGQGSTKEGSGISVPFFVSGPWTKLSYKPNTKALASAVVEQVTKGGLGNLLGGVLGGKKSGDAAPADSGQKHGFNLGGLFGR